MQFVTRVRNEQMKPQTNSIQINLKVIQGYC